MSFLKKYFGLHVIASAVGILGFVLAIYVEFFKVSEITLDHVASVNAFEINEATDKLKIYLNGQAIDPEKINITWEKFYIQNTGSLDILQDYFDKENEWGIEVIDGDILDVGVVKSNDSYLAQKVKTKLRKNEVILPHFIFDKGQSFSLELIVKHASDQHPQFHLFGKISGTNFKDKNELAEQTRGNLVERSFSGSAPVQVVRVLVYFLAFIFILILSVGFVALLLYVTSFITTPWRARRFDEKSYVLGSNISKRAVAALRDFYLKKGTAKVRDFRELLRSGQGRVVLNRYIKDKIIEKQEYERSLKNAEREIFTTGVTIAFVGDFSEIVEVLYEENLIKLGDSLAAVDSKLLDFITDLTGGKDSPSSAEPACA